MGDGMVSELRQSQAANRLLLGPLLPLRHRKELRLGHMLRPHDHMLACNLDNFLRTLALPEAVEHWSLTTLREKLIKIGAKMVRHGRYFTFQLAEVAVPRDLFRKILRLIDALRPRPYPA